MITPLLEVKKLRKKHKQSLILDEVNLKINEKEIVGLIGPNGSGKTTTFYSIMGFIKPSSGNIFFKGKEITSLPIQNRIDKGIGYLPQEESIFRGLTARQNLLAILEHNPLLNRKEREFKTDELLERFRLSEIGERCASVLSGGEKRRLSIARSLCSSPKLILLDEPFSGIDPISIKEVQTLIQEIRETEKISVLITDHNASEILKMSDKCFLLLNGRTIIEGTPEEISRNPIARNRYLGEI